MPHNSPTQIGLPGDENIDLLPPDYDLLDPNTYAINDTYYGYTSRGCVNSCPWIAFDRASEERHYVRAVRLAQKHGVREFSNYMLYNWQDSPHDLYARLVVNIQLNEEWRKDDEANPAAAIYSYPMRFAPINSEGSDHANRRRDVFRNAVAGDRNWLTDAVWTRRFVRNIEIMKGAAHGAISPTPTLAWRTIGETYEEFLANLYMPEELLRNRNKHEQRVHRYEPRRPPGTGKVEEFRRYVLRLLKSGGLRFREFHDAVSDNSVEQVRRAMEQCKDQEMLKWFQLYLKK